MVSLTLGGLGLFLLGMVLMTDGLKALAGDALQRVLHRFTGGPISGFVTGAGITALVQSSSATTLATIGFVSAGLLTFPQALGVIFGANVGTTSTSWIVSLLGLKLSVSKATFPLIGIGALARLLGRGRLAAAGTALAGFGLVFLGIDTLQSGMKELAERVDPSSFPQGNFLGRLALVGVGVVMTVVMQSSSAASATTLAALSAGTIDLTQAAALVVGQNVGTTVTAGFAAVGASVPAKRTALAHVLFNVATGIVAFAVLPLFVGAVDALTERNGGDDATTLAAFHTAFNLLGVMMFLPFTQAFARVVTRFVPEAEPELTRDLDRTVAALPPVALEAARRTLVRLFGAAAALTRDELSPESPHDAAEAEAQIVAIERGLVDVRRFVAGVQSGNEATEVHARHLALLHATDHLARLVSACRERTSVAAARRDPTLGRIATDLRTALAPVAENPDDVDAALSTLKAASIRIAEVRRRDRPEVLARTARGELDPDTALVRLEAMRWVDRVGYHAFRAMHHLAGRGPSKVDAVANDASGAASEAANGPRSEAFVDPDEPRDAP
jgi:phosphate:Na+ symporter